MSHGSSVLTSSAGTFVRTYEFGTQVVFGRPWSSELPSCLSGAVRPAVLCSPGRAQDAEVVAAALGSGASVIPLARQHVPAEVVSAAAAQLARERVDAIVAFGGGSAIGLAKALQLDERDRRFAALPTTYSGSEMTSLYGIREGGTKRVGRSERVRPQVVVYDPELTIDLPVATSVVSLFNAMAHAVDALYARDPAPGVNAMAAEALAGLAGAIRDIPAAPRDLGVRRRAQLGAHLAGTILGTSGMALHHKLAHILGGELDLPHAETHTAILPHVIAFNAPSAPEATHTIAAALGTDDPAGFVFDLARAAGAPTALGSLGMTVEGAAQVAASLAAAIYDNPRKPTSGEIDQLLSAIRTGRRPSR